MKERWVVVSPDPDRKIARWTWRPGDWFPQTCDFGEGERSINIRKRSANEGNAGLPLEFDVRIEP